MVCEINIADKKFSNDSCIYFSLFWCLFLLVILGKRHGLFIKEGKDEVEWKPKEISRSFSE